jgi:uncharacterized protein
MAKRCSENSAMDDLKPPSPPPPERESVELEVMQPKPPFLYFLFLGPEGLRAGWRLVLYYALYEACIYLGGQLATLWNSSATSQLWFYMFGESVFLGSSLLAALVMARIENRSFGEYGLPRRGAFAKLFWVGALWGLVAITALLVAMREAHVFDFGHLLLHGSRLVKFAAFWGAFFLLVGFYEEFHFRGYVLFTLSKALKFLDHFAPGNAASRVPAMLSYWLAAALLSARFGSVHLSNAGENWVGALAAALLGLFFCLTLRRTGNLWFAVGFHTSFDWGETYLYSVPNSGMSSPGHLLSSSFHGPAWLTGGSVGPEGSVLVFVMIAGLWIAFDRTYHEVRYPGLAVSREVPRTAPERRGQACL